MLADISGFTRLSEQLSGIGPKGADLLSTTLSKFYGLLIEKIQSQGGDVQKFAGDALIVLWSQKTQGSNEYGRRAIQVRHFLLQTD